MRADVRQFILSGWKTERIELELGEAEFSQQFQRYTSYVLDRKRWSFGTLIFPSTPSMPEMLSSVLLCNDVAPSAINVFEFMQREWCLPVPKMLLSVIGSSKSQGPLWNKEEILGFLEYKILKAFESCYKNFWTITGVQNVLLLCFVPNISCIYCRGMWRYSGSFGISAK